MDLQAVHRLDLLLPGNPEAVVDQLVCGLCLDLLLKPVSCKSGHTFCLQCITRAMQSNPTCPGGCNDIFPLLALNKSLIAQGCVDSLQCRCPNAPAPAAPALPALVATVEEQPAKEADAEAGSPSSSSSSVIGGIQCTWTGPFGQLCDHLKRCGPCGFVGCGFEGTGDVLAAHRLACPKRRVPCPHCQEATALDGLEGHYEVCKEMAVLCPFACMGCPTSLARESMPAHIASDAAQHAALLEAHLQTHAMPSATFELTIKNVQQKIAGKETVISQNVPFRMAGFPVGRKYTARQHSQVFLEVRFGDSNGGVQRDGETLGVYVYFEFPGGTPRILPPPEICFQGTTITLVSQDGAVKNVEECMTTLDYKGPLGDFSCGLGWPAFCQDVTPFIKDDTIVVRATIRARLTAPAAAAFKHTVA